MAPERNMGLAGSEPSRDEVRQRVNSLYDHAESATETFNATRARAARSFDRIAPAGRGTRRDSDAGVDAITQQWFDAGRTLRGPTVRAVLPPDRMPPPPPMAPSTQLTEGRPTGPAVPPKQLESPRSIPELPAAPAPAPQSPLAPAGITAGPALALDAPPAAAAPAMLTAAVAAPPEQPQFLPLPATESLSQQGVGGATLPAAPPATLPAVNAPISEGAPAESPLPEPVPAAGGRGLAAVAFARAQTGKPCVWGATGPDSYDCSSLTQAAWRTVGVDLPRAAQDQAFAGRPVSLTSLLPGDLVFFHADAHHVGLFTGDGTVIHAPAPGRVVREEPILTAGEAPVHSAVRPA
ncbi:C40 family peptidase [Streptomyces acidicola]|uniref:C40 family peptidase n=1 Tax=Streptomyces acidicola TaxID=2596892 RepID=UPI00343AA87D